MFCLQRIQAKSTQVLPKRTAINTVPKNNFWHYLTLVWNSVSKSRIDQVGPDRACAEWLMRNGALVRWKGQSKFVSHYNNLPKDEDPGKYYLQEVDATESSISHHGFSYFKNCNHVEKMKLEECLYLDDSALKKLDYLKSSLNSLSIIKCYSISKKGLLSLEKLCNLKELHLTGLTSIEREDLTVCMEELTKKLPFCEIRTSEAVIKDKPEEK